MMETTYTTGTWVPFEGKDEEFIAAWGEFVQWATTLPGAGRAVLAADHKHPGQYVSFMEWESNEAVRAWKSSPDFKPRMAKVQAFIDKFTATELGEVTAIVGGVTA
jgi:heme-degrading monooxygenase HmoA